MRQQIWNGILDANHAARYYQLLANKLRRRHLVISAVLAVSASGAAVSLLAQLPDALSAIVLFIAACLSIWLYFADYSGKATAAGLFSDQYRDLETAWKQLWYDEPAIEAIRTLQERDNKIAAGYELDIDEDLKRKLSGTTMPWSRKSSTTRKAGRPLPNPDPPRPPMPPPPRLPRLRA